MPLTFEQALDAATALQAAGKPVSIDALWRQLKASGVRVAQPWLGSAEEHCDLVQELYARLAHDGPPPCGPGEALMQLRIPAVFWRFAAYWRLPAALTRLWWQALSQSRYTQPQALRQAGLLWEGTSLADPAAVVHQTCAPVEVVAVLEALVHEGRLSRQRATQVEEHLLARVTREGHWH
jgi:hypothetical protein